MQVTCPQCSKKLKVPDTAAGKKVRCPGCQTSIPVPGEAVAVAPPPIPRSSRPAPPDLPAPGVEEKVVTKRSTMRCAACKEATLEKLPPNQFSRNPGYVCRSCNTIMRPPESTALYVFLCILGGAITLMGIGMLFIAFDAETSKKRLISGAATMTGLGVMAAIWTFKQLRLPVPLDAPARPSRLGFYLVIALLLVLLFGGGLFGFMYFLHEM